MRKFYQNLVHSEENILKTTKLLIKKLDLKVSKSSIKKSLESHPDYPSQLSMSDVLKDFGINNVSLKLELQ